MSSPAESKPVEEIAANGTDALCRHCGEACPEASPRFEGHSFCCEGCRTVYQVLNDNGLCRYYEIDPKAGVSLRGRARAEYAFLDEPELRERLIDFSDGEKTRLTLYLPQIHCASCIWLLENLYRLNEGILESKVNFLKKEIYLVYAENRTSLREVVELLSSVGYAPAINLGDLDKEERPAIDRPFFFKLGVAGFAFGNIMLLSFPEYLGLDTGEESAFVRLFGYLNILLSIPVLTYSARDYLRSAWLVLRRGSLNLDVPISLGIVALFGRSAFEILSHTGAGYLDSFAGLIFFLLIGKWFQQRTYHNISFERDYKSYFPIAARKLSGGKESSVSLDRLAPGDVLLVKHQELVPADSVLLRGEALIDYSFVTGEAEPAIAGGGEKIFAGGRQMGGPIEISLLRRVSQSYLTQLWNDEAFTKRQDTKAGRLADLVGKRFTAVILLVAFATLAYWLPRDAGVAINAFTAVLIIACPCAAALAIPFIFGNALRIMGRKHFYLKNTAVIEALRDFSAAVFDKTGTITQRDDGRARFVGAPLSARERQIVRALTAPSTHPVSRQIAQALRENLEEDEAITLEMTNWKEALGQGVLAEINGEEFRLGSPAFMRGDNARGVGVFLEIDARSRGYFLLERSTREGMRELLAYFRERGPVFLLSGDDERERASLAPLFGEDDERLRFRQSPHDKLRFVKQLQSQGHRVLMIGDGLNDAGALRQANAGIVVAEDTNNFTPACDAIIHAQSFPLLPAFVEFSRAIVRLLFGAYAFAFVYNIIGLSFAVQGLLSPIVAAILMPMSSVSIVLFGILGSNWLGKDRRFGR
jgi:Cu+-exporting ATPase